ncbi:hypothetical protein [Spirosoma oryzae]|nr:hypothetical protein [Spirosoma oryzae]
MDWYVKYPIIKDLAFVVLVWLGSYRLPIFDFKVTDKANQLNIMSSIIGASISLAGFLIAALTIIVTYKLTTKDKKAIDTNLPTELVFVSRHYYRMIAVFRDAIIELLICTVFLYVVWASSDNITVTTANKAVVSGIMLVTLPIFRSLALLFKLLNLDKSTEDHRHLLEEEEY